MPRSPTGTAFRSLPSSGTCARPSPPAWRWTETGNGGMTAAARIPAADIDQFILDEAADWLVLFQSGEATDGDRARLARWRARSAAHEAAWQKAEGVLATFRQVPP